MTSRFGLLDNECIEFKKTIDRIDEVYGEAGSSGRDNKQMRIRQTQDITSFGESGDRLVCKEKLEPVEGSWSRTT